MTYKVRPILKTYYDALDEGRVLGMQCNDCHSVVWPPLPTCQSCQSTNVEWLELSGEATIEEFNFIDHGEGLSGSFFTGNIFAVIDEAYCLCTGKLKEGTAFNGALFGVNASNAKALTGKLPFTAQFEFMQMQDGFKSVGFRIQEN